MVAEREVSLKLSTRAAGDIDAPLRKVAAAATQAAKAHAAQGDALKKNVSELDKYVKGANAAAAADRAFARDKNALAAAIDRERAAKEKSAALDKARGGGFLGSAVPSLMRLGGIAGGVAVAGLAVAGQVQDVAQHGGPFKEGVFRRGKFNEDAMRDSLLWKAGEIPLVGRLVKLSDAYISLEERVKNVKEAEEALARTEARIAIMSPFVSRKTALLDQQAAVQAKLQFGFSSMAPQFGLGVAGQAAIEQRQRALSAIGGAGTPPGVGLETRKADIAARGQYETRAAQMLVEQERQRNLLGSREGRADSEVTEKRKKLEEAKLLLAGAKDRKGQLDRDMEGLSADRPLTDKQRQRARGIDRAMQANEFFPRLGGSSDPALGGFGYVKESQETEDKRLRKLGGQDASADKKLKADLDYKGQIAAVEDAQLHLQEALNAQQALSVARGESLLEQQKERIGLMQVERDRLTGIIAQEKSRKEGAKVALGMQNPLMRKQLVGLAKSISEGKTLSERELQFASAHGGELFRPAVEEIARKRAGPEYDQIAKYLKSDEREKAAAEARVTLDQKITIELKDNAEAMAAVAAKRILPEIEGMMKLMIEQMILALEKYKVQQRLVNAPGAAQ